MAQPLSAPTNSAPISARPGTDGATAPAPLDRGRESVSTPARKKVPGPLATTKQRYQLQAGIARLLRGKNGRGPSVCGCGRVAFEKTEVGVYLNEGGRAGLIGATRCGSLFLCPVCAMRRSMQLGDRAGAAAQACIDQGGAVWFITLTVRHHNRQSLRTLKAALMAGWKTLQQGRAFIAFRERAGLLGMVRTIETPWGPTHGWHVHLHVLALFEGRDFEAQEAWCEEIIARWRFLMAAQGFDARRQAQDCRRCFNGETAAEYATKGAIELTASAVKESKSDLIHPFEIAARAVAGDDAAEAVWREYAAVMPGTQQAVVSKRLATALGISNEGEVEPDVERVMLPVVGAVRPYAWNTLHRGGVLGVLLELVEGTCTTAGPGWEAAVDPWIEAQVRRLDPANAKRASELTRKRRKAAPGVGPGQSPSRPPEDMPLAA